MVSSFARDVTQLSLAANVVTTDILSDIGNILARYFKDGLGAGTYEVRMDAPTGTRGERYLLTLWSARGSPYTTPLVNPDGTIRGHTSYAVLNNKPLWILCTSRGALKDARTYDDHWSHATDLPPYRGWPDDCFFTEIVLPIGQPPTGPIGFLNLEFQEVLDCSTAAKKELQQVAAAIDTFCGLYRNYKRQVRNTRNAIRNLNSDVPYSPLRKPKLFFAFSGTADEEVVGLAKDILGEFSAHVLTISWDEMQLTGNINLQIRNILASSAYGLCYLSEPSSADPGCYVDNLNVVFEAGMFQALTSDQKGQARWIPIREKSISPTPFDFAHERMLIVPRDGQGKLNRQRLQSELRKRLDNLVVSKVKS